MMLKIKGWFFDKTQDAAKRYNIWIDVEYADKDENGITRIKREDDCVFVHTLSKEGENEILAESEKAIKVRLSTGLVDGSSKGWETWIPKSVIA